MRLAFLGSPPFAVPVCSALLASRHDVAALVVRPDKPRGRGRKVVASELAQMGERAGVTVLQPKNTKDEAFLDQLRALELDVLMVASYGEILRTEFLELAPQGALNVHASLLPRWRGASPIQRAILAGDRTTGVCVQRIVLALDEGDVLLSRETPIGANETSGQLLDRLALLGGDVAVEALDLLESGKGEFTPQDGNLATFAPKLSKEDGKLRIDQPAGDIERVVRGMSPWPGARLTLADGRELVVLEARAVEAERAAPGTLIDLRAARVSAGQGAIELVRVKPPGKGAMEGAAFLRGLRAAAGDQLIVETTTTKDECSDGT
ncbi:MAG: methionyl-tRNA formyltransferase [Planctomycetota bacterium]|jgi:methionyl-tRNA formyltransferase